MRDMRMRHNFVGRENARKENAFSIVPYLHVSHFSRLEHILNEHEKCVHSLWHFVRKQLVQTCCTNEA